MQGGETVICNKYISRPSVSGLGPHIINAEHANHYSKCAFIRSVNAAVVRAGCRHRLDSSTESEIPKRLAGWSPARFVKLQQPGLVAPMSICVFGKL